MESASMEQKKQQKTKPRQSGTPLKSIELLYQPVFDTHLNMAIDYETSMRINDRKLGVLQPFSLFP